MLTIKGFNEWSGNYDNSIINSKGYPFEGYYQLFGTIENIIKKLKHPKVLDLGIGTGTLSLQLQKNGAEITGVDFSEDMLEIAKNKLKTVTLYHQDLTEGLPVEILHNTYDYIVSTYSFHHIPNGFKKMYIKHLVSCLNSNGQLIIGDIAFKTKEDLLACKKENEGHWDTEEAGSYFVFETLNDFLNKNFDVTYEQFSVCGGLIIIRRKK